MSSYYRICDGCDCQCCLDPGEYPCDQADQDREGGEEDGEVNRTARR